MDIKNIFKRERNISVNTLLDYDHVKRVVSEFTDTELFNARAVIIIWATKEGDIKVRLGGGIHNECTALGVLEYGKDIIKEEGIPL